MIMKWLKRKTQKSLIMYPERYLRVEHGRCDRAGFTLKTGLFCQKLDQGMNLPVCHSPRSKMTEKERETEREEGRMRGRREGRMRGRSEHSWHNK